VTLLCDVAVADAGSLALMDVTSLNHRLHRNINSARNYTRPSTSSEAGPPRSHSCRPASDEAALGIGTPQAHSGSPSAASRRLSRRIPPTTASPR
jgi:hypothetical protein